jgi:hypothetical protein
MGNTSNKFSPEVRSRAVRLFLENSKHRDHTSIHIDDLAIDIV